MISIAVALAVGDAVAQAVDFGVYELRYQALNSNTHASIFGIASILASAAAVALAAAAARRARTRAAVVLACALAVVLVLRAWQPNHVLVFALPFTAVALVLLWRQGTGEGQRMIRAGCVLLVVSFGIHAVESGSLDLFSLSSDSWAYQIRCVLKHDAELAGWVLIAGGLLSLARGRRPRGALERSATQVALVPRRADR